MASGIPGALGAAALSPAMAAGRDEHECVKAPPSPGNSVMATERKSASVVTSAAQVCAIHL